MFFMTTRDALLCYIMTNFDVRSVFLDTHILSSMEGMCFGVVVKNRYSSGMVGIACISK
jgi:hypothetical protein